jgi:hypothetical protein
MRQNTWPLSHFAAVAQLDDSSQAGVHQVMFDLLLSSLCVQSDRYTVCQRVRRRLSVVRYPLMSRKLRTPGKTMIRDRSPVSTPAAILRSPQQTRMPRRTRRASHFQVFLTTTPPATAGFARAGRATISSLNAVVVLFSMRETPCQAMRTR